MSIQGDIVSNPIVGTLASSALIVNNMSCLDCVEIIMRIFTINCWKEQVEIIMISQSSADKADISKNVIKQENYLYGNLVKQMTLYGLNQNCDLNHMSFVSFCDSHAKSATEGVTIL